MKVLNFTRMMYLILGASIILQLAYAQGGGSTGGNSTGGSSNSTNPQISTLSAEFCSIVNDVRDVIGILALAMFLVGAILYAGGNFMPAAGNIKSSTQGWAMGMIVGGVIGIILVIAGPFILSIIAGFGNGAIPKISC